MSAQARGYSLAKDGACSTRRTTPLVILPRRIISTIRPKTCQQVPNGNASYKIPEAAKGGL